MTLRSEQSSIDKGQRTWALALLTIIYGFNQLDRGIVAILLESIKADIRLSDTELGLMTGLGFSVVYALASFPIGRLADRTNRISLIAIGAGLYSIVAALMGFSQTLTQLILGRSFVAIGEATGGAPSASVIADLYPAEEGRTRAIAIWSAGAYLGIFAGLGLGGWLNANYVWRVALWATALPGALCALLLKLTVAEPVRGATEKPGLADSSLPLGETLRYLFGQPSFRWMFAALTAAGLTTYSFQIWVPSLLQRVHHMDKAEVGLYSGMFKGLLGLAGILTGGFLAERLARGNDLRLPIVPIAVALFTAPALLLFLLSGSSFVSLVGLGLGSFLMPGYQAASLAIVHAIAPPRMRAFAVTILFAGIAFGGLGLGPLIVGSLSDLLTPALGQDALRYALIIPALVPLGTSACFYQVRRAILEARAMSSRLA